MFKHSNSFFNFKKQFTLFQLTIILSYNISEDVHQDSSKILINLLLNQQFFYLLRKDYSFLLLTKYY